MNEMRTTRYAVFGILLVALMFLAAIPAVSAAPAIPSATLNSPADVNNVHSGDVISIQVGGLNTGDHFSYRITSTDLVTPSTSVSLSGVNMPFAFTTGTSVTTLTTTGVTLSKNPLTVKYGGAEYSPAKTAGTNTITANQNIKAGNYDVTLTALTKTSTMTGIDYSVAGDVAAPVVSAPLSFTVTNVNTGHLTVEVTNNGAPLLYQTFAIVAPPAPLNPGGGSEGYGGSDGGNTGQGQGAPQAGPGKLLAPRNFRNISNYPP